MRSRMSMVYPRNWKMRALKAAAISGKQSDSKGTVVLVDSKWVISLGTHDYGCACSSGSKYKKKEMRLETDFANSRAH